MRPRLRILVTWFVLAAALAAGCGRNEISTVLAPTGIRPAPDSWPGSLTGAVFFDPVNTPDLGAAPFPPTRVELFFGSEVVAVDSLDAASRVYRFTGLAPGSYSIVARSTAFFANSRGGLPVREGELDAGNITLSLNSLALSNNVYVAGSIPGLGVDELLFGTGIMDANTLGIWTYPNSLWPPVELPAGTYRFKFVTDESSTLANLIGWGGDPSDTLTVPVTNALAIRGSGPATDIVVRFPTTGTYAFTFDERRQRFSIALLPPAPASRSRRLP